MAQRIEALIALQAFHVMFLLLHDWVPLPPWNDVEAQRATDPLRKRLWTTALSAAPYVLLLALTLREAGALSRPLLLWLWVGYGVLFAGELRAWWVPYFLVADPERAARYRALFGRTRSFLRERNGVRPNTLHVVLHVATFATLLCLLLLSRP